MNIRLIDTTIMLNLLGVPKRNKDEKEVREEFKRVLAKGETLILPIATIIETGNEIAKINGSQRYEIVSKFSEYLKKTSKGEAPWKPELTMINLEDLIYFAENYTSFASTGIGLGDLSIIRTFERCKEKLQVDSIMIWSTDKHLQGYKEESVYKHRRRK